MIETRNSFWYFPAPLVLMSLSFHRPICIGHYELLHVFLKGLPAVVRFPCATTNQQIESGIFVCSSSNYGLDILEHKARNQTRRALERCVVQQVEFAYAARCGYPLHVETTDRQGRARGTHEERDWLNLCLALGRSTDFEAWGAFVDGRLAAVLLGGLVGDRFSILRQVSATATLNAYPNNALAFAVTNAKLKTAGISSVTYGLRSLEPTPGLDRFKRNMGYTIEPAVDRIVFNPLIKAVAHPIRKLFEKGVQAKPGDDLLRKGLSVLNHLFG